MRCTFVFYEAKQS